MPLATGQASRIQLAADAVVNPANGQIVCRSTLTTPNNGCQPANLFGTNNFSQAAKDYLYGTATQTQKFRQHVFAANVQGDLFNTWAGAVPIAIGGEYRTNKVATDADPISATSGFYVFNSSIVSGEVKVKEGYLETAVPLAKDLPALRVAGPEWRRARDGLQHQRQRHHLEIRSHVRAARLAAFPRHAVA